VAAWFRVGDRVMQIRNNYDRDVFTATVGGCCRGRRSDEAGESQAWWFSTSAR